MSAWWDQFKSWLGSRLGLRPSSSDPIARRGEEAAAKHLRREGYSILARNHRVHHGEIDLVALTGDGKTLVIVEVKAGALRYEAGSGRKHRPENHVNQGKQRKLARLAASYVKTNGHSDKRVRFDVIGIDFIDGKSPEIRHHVNAFQSYF